MGPTGKTQHAIRRSTRLPLEIPVRIASIDAALLISEECNTTLVNAHGCGLIAKRPIPHGIRVRLEIVSVERHVAARVAEVVSLGGDPETWLVGLELEVPGNFWGIQYAPSDWKVEGSHWAEEAPQQTEHGSLAAATQVPTRKWRLTDISVGACYLESTLPFSANTAVLMSIRVLDTDCLLEGIVRVSHPGTGMGIEFMRAQGDLPIRVDELISRLTSSREVPRIFVGRKESNAADKLPSMDEVKDESGTKPDALRDLIREGASLTTEQFTNDLRAQRNRNKRDLQAKPTSAGMSPV
jgi:hypothetical protein